MEEFLYGYNKVDSKYFEVKIYNHRVLHLVYGKLDINFDQLWYHKNRSKICLNLNVFELKYV
jgi:hypothetical protein